MSQVTEGRECLGGTKGSVSISRLEQAREEKEGVLSFLEHLAEAKHPRDFEACIDS